jgi:hypothetical protein
MPLNKMASSVFNAVNSSQPQVPSKVGESPSVPESSSPPYSAGGDSLLSQRQELNSKPEAPHKLKGRIRSSRLPAADRGESVHATALPSETKI